MKKLKTILADSPMDLDNQVNEWLRCMPTQGKTDITFQVIDHRSPDGDWELYYYAFIKYITIL